MQYFNKCTHSHIQSEAVLYMERIRILQNAYFPEDLLTQVPVLTQMTKQTGQEQKLRQIQMDAK